MGASENTIFRVHFLESAAVRASLVNEVISGQVVTDWTPAFFHFNCRVVCGLFGVSCKEKHPRAPGWKGEVAVAHPGSSYLLGLSFSVVKLLIFVVIKAFCDNEETLDVDMNIQHGCPWTSTPPPDISMYGPVRVIHSHGIQKRKRMLS